MVGIRGLWSSIALVAALLAGGGTSASAAAGPGAADRAATVAYLRAKLAFEQANLKGLDAAIAAVRVQAARIQGECPGMLKGAPSRGGLLSRSGLGAPSARAQGEAARSERQLGYLDLELYATLNAPVNQAEAANLAAFAAAVLPLRWSSPRIAAAVLAEVHSKQAPVRTPSLCADMRSWAASSFKEVSPGTRAFLAEEEARFRAVTAPVEALLGPEERTPAAKAAILALHRLDRQAARASAPLQELARSLERALGLPPLETFRPPKPGVVVGRGRTAAGERWVARVRRSRGGCPVELSIAGDTGESEGSSSGWCLSEHQRSAQPSVNCNEGRLAISSFTLPRTALVRLTLSGGRTIVTTPIRVPRQLGGPVGLYYQVVRGPSPIPRLLTELGPGGRVLRVTHLPAVVECTRNPVKDLSVQTLVTGTVPGGGPRFTIVGERYRFLGKVYFDLKTRFSEEPHGIFGGFGEGGSSGGHFFVGSGSRRPVLTVEESTGCLPHPYDIVFGMLHATGETVVASGPGAASVTLANVPLPASLHQHGEFFWGAFSPPPATLSLRDAAGATLATDPLETQEFVERCEGEAEPGGPIP